MRDLSELKGEKKKGGEPEDNSERSLHDHENVQIRSWRATPHEKTETRFVMTFRELQKGGRKLEDAPELG